MQGHFHLTVTCTKKYMLEVIEFMKSIASSDYDNAYVFETAMNYIFTGDNQWSEKNRWDYNETTGELTIPQNIMKAAANKKLVITIGVESGALNWFLPDEFFLDFVNLPNISKIGLEGSYRLYGYKENDEDFVSPFDEEDYVDDYLDIYKKIKRDEIFIPQGDLSPIIKERFLSRTPGGAYEEVNSSSVYCSSCLEIIGAKEDVLKFLTRPLSDTLFPEDEFLCMKDFIEKITDTQEEKFSVVHESDYDSEVWCQLKFRKANSLCTVNIFINYVTYNTELDGVWSIESLSDYYFDYLKPACKENPQLKVSFLGCGHFCFDFFGDDIDDVTEQPLARLIFSSKIGEQEINLLDVEVKRYTYSDYDELFRYENEELEYLTYDFSQYTDEEGYMLSDK